MAEDADTPCRPLRLLAMDADDLQIVSAALQDAIAHVGDIRYEPKARRLTIMFNRYRWEANAPGGERVVSALQLGDVSRVRHRGLASDDKGALVCTLAVDFEPASEPPGGCVYLRFCEGCDLAVEVECIDAVLADVSEAWPAKGCPDHAKAEADAVQEA